MKEKLMEELGYIGNAYAGVVQLLVVAVIIAGIIAAIRRVRR